MGEANLFSETPYEIIGGKVVSMSPSASSSHSTIIMNLAHIFTAYLLGKPCRVFSELDVRFTKENVFRPDFMVVCDKSKIKLTHIQGAPDLVVEVLSPRTAKYDRIHKLKTYGECGVREYWIVLPNEKAVEVYLLSGKSLELDDIYTHWPKDILEEMLDEEKSKLVFEFKTSLFEDLIINLEDLFAKV
ncbi:MAG: Uma2 family endonuclease [Clostridiales bacterium]|jgi:Uma2 family endonuclease|nr:Uma2 family endonuclease [Clostridiales bacterium]